MGFDAELLAAAGNIITDPIPTSDGSVFHDTCDTLTGWTPDSEGNGIVTQEGGAFKYTDLGWAVNNLARVTKGNNFTTPDDLFTFTYELEHTKLGDLADGSPFFVIDSRYPASSLYRLWMNLWSDNITVITTASGGVNYPLTMPTGKHKITGRVTYTAPPTPTATLELWVGVDGDWIKLIDGDDCYRAVGAFSDGYLAPLEGDRINEVERNISSLYDIKYGGGLA